MIRRQYITKEARWKAAILLSGLLIGIAAGTLNYFIITAEAEAGTTDAWIICQPGDWVNARRRPSGKSESLGRLEPGDQIRVTGKTKNGWAEAKVSLEEDTAWIWGGYIVFDEPEAMQGRSMTVRADGRVACRKCIEGDRRCWIVDGCTVRVHYLTSAWAVTDRGFIKAEYLAEE